MPLHDHFHEPDARRLHWESLHSGWATYLATRLMRRWLPDDCEASEHIHFGPRVEIDIAAIEDTPATGGVAVQTRAYAAPPALGELSITFPDRFEVLLHSQGDGFRLIGAIEFVSPRNKDREDSRSAFVAKCASYLHQGVAVAIIDIVTSRHANLHNDLIAFLGGDAGLRLPADCGTYAAAYRPFVRDESPLSEVWAERCVVGSDLPTMPLHLRPGLVVPVEFEASYMEFLLDRRFI